MSVCVVCVCVVCVSVCVVCLCVCVGWRELAPSCSGSEPVPSLCMPLLLIVASALASS